MKNYLLLLLLALPLAVKAQNVHFKIGGGLSSHYGSSSQVIGAFKIGVGYELELSQKLTFTPGIEMYGKGWKDPNATVFCFDDQGKPLYNDETGEPLTGIMNRSATQNYLEVPLLFSYFLRTGESRYVVFSAGPYVAYGISGKQKTKGDQHQQGVNRFYYENKTFDEPSTHRFDWGVQTFIGYQFSTSFTIGLEADWGVAKFTDNGKRNVSVLISLGYKL